MSLDLFPAPLLLAELPSTRPFTATEAIDRGITRSQLRRLVDEGLLVHPMRGVWHRAQLIDCLDLRVACLRLVVPPDCVVTDRTAAWLLGARTALAPTITWSYRRSRSSARRAAACATV